MTNTIWKSRITEKDIYFPTRINSFHLAEIVPNLIYTCNYFLQILFWNKIKLLVYDIQSHFLDLVRSCWEAN